jgi:DNA-directed RNA polymerase specialized sigma subunit
MLHEAGMHGLMQAVNDYDHNNPNKASFATHVGNKIRGLQMTAMKNIDQIPAEVRRAQKQFQSKGKAASILSTSPHPKATDMQDRLKRIGAAKATHEGKQTVRRTGAAAQPKPVTAPISIPKIEDEGEE